MEWLQVGKEGPRRVKEYNFLATRGAGGSKARPVL